MAWSEGKVMILCNSGNISTLLQTLTVNYQSAIVGPKVF